MADPSVSEELDALAEVLRALAHPVRLQILHAICERELSVGEIEDATGIGQPGLSQQLSILRKADLVLSQRSGKQVFYQVDPERMSGIGHALAVMGGKAEVPPPQDAPVLAPDSGAARFARVFR
ncbi:ArsR/SmtB family transcription factor [Novosphingobium aerophilum]|uniref:ArsR/SmtB family transcription factor n=1 Tax=Novosphingobium TaxID=165696 RepID=UPI0012C3E650|nr:MULTISPECIES: metalloregulator ArsR/SmtB family transcription factor [unclassified Novosphingobium]MPS67570.1 ArsR family transcriptional regulator [Novosphingobium sp.]WRT93171.1 metalloregulator ArsR/SmtB family transcription factor [Novosphingobium sp. RL4]